MTHMQEKHMTHTYQLIGAKFSMEAKKIKQRENRNYHMVSLRKLPCCVSFSNLSSLLGKSSHHLSMYLSKVCSLYVN